MKTRNLKENHVCVISLTDAGVCLSAADGALLSCDTSVFLQYKTTHSDTNLLRCAEIYHVADVGGLVFFFQAGTQVQESRDAVYNCDNDGKQLLQKSFSVTSTHLNCSL